MEDVEVTYQRWMDDHGKTSAGIEFDETDALCYKYPELSLDPKEEALMEEQERKIKSKKKNQTETIVLERGNLNTMGMGLEINTNSSGSTVPDEFRSSHVSFEFEPLNCVFGGWRPKSNSIGYKCLTIIQHESTIGGFRWYWQVPKCLFR